MPTLIELLFVALFAVVALTGPLWPAMAMHALMDLGGGAMAWLVLRDQSQQAKVSRAGV